MQEFYFEDKVNHKIVMGIAAHDDINCPPYDYYVWKGVELKAVLKDRKVLVVRVYHKGDVWHCFYGTYKGLNGEELGAMGSQSHYHYISDKWGYSRAELNHFIETINMPSSPVHILFKHEYRK